MIITKKFYCYFFISLWCSIAYPSTTDSLHFSADVTSKSQQQLHNLHQQVAQLLSEDPEAALRPATDAWQLANELNLPIELARTQSDLGKIYLHLGNYQHALQYLAEVEKTYRTHQQRIPLAQTQLLLAEVSNLQEDFAAAGNYLNSARGTIELADDPLWLAEWNLQMAIRYQGLQQYEKAATLYDRVIPILQRASTNNESLLMKAYEKDFQVRQLYNPVSELKQSNYYAWFTLLVSGAVLLVILGLLYYRIARLNRQHKEELKTKVSQQTQELQATNEALAEANAELQRFAYISSHDLKEPLRNIASFTTLIKRKMANHLDSDTEEYFQFVSRNTRQIADLVTDIFEYSSLNEKDIFFSYVDVNEVMETAIKPLQQLMEKKGGSVVYSDLPMIYSNAGYLQLIFKNLIENGLKYNKSEQPQVCISCHETKEYFQFDITDNGIGISKEYHNYIFEMFRRLNNRKKEGSGLGLAICKKILRRLNGKITLSSTLNQGTTFHIVLPKNLGQSSSDIWSNPVQEINYSNMQTRLNWVAV